MVVERNTIPSSNTYSVSSYFIATCVLFCFAFRSALSCSVYLPVFPTLQRTNTENWKQIFTEKVLRDHSPNFHIPISVSDLHIPKIAMPIAEWMRKLGLRPRNPKKGIHKWDFPCSVHDCICRPVLQYLFYYVLFHEGQRCLPFCYRVLSCSRR